MNHSITLEKSKEWLRRLPQRLSATPRRLALVYLAAITLAETVTNLLNPHLGLALHGLLLLGLIFQASLVKSQRMLAFWISLCLTPLIRLLSLSIPFTLFPFIYWYMVVGIPLLLAAFTAMRLGQIKIREQGLNLRSAPAQLLIGVTGAGLGLIEYLILRPQPLVSALTLEQVWLPALILLIFTGFLEEWVFRGLMQHTAMRVLGAWGLVYVAAIFAIMHLGYRSLLDVLFVFAVALFFGWARLRSGSLVGVTIAHGLTNIGLFLVFPFLIP
jgi:membrane protease YdiL (CAAX protease family)